MRLGLVLYGGVSLAVYIYGVVIEVQRLLGAPGSSLAYAGALREAGIAKARVDVIAGASAGGINGILLSRALATGGDVRKAKGLWLDGADFADLLRGSRDGDPDSLLNTRLMEELILDGLELAGGEVEPGANDVLDLFVSATHVRGNRRRFPTDLGGEIGTLVHRYVFQRKLRGRYGRQELDALSALVKLARATSAFPVAFDPVELAREDGLLDLTDEPSGWFADGGILNNKPFTEALETIFTRESNLRVKRWLLSVDPDPKGLYEGKAPGPKPSFVETAAGALVGIPRYQSIAADLERLEAHNADAQHTTRVLLSLERSAAADRPSLPPAGGPPGEPPGGPPPPSLARGAFANDDDAAYRHMRDQIWADEIGRWLSSTVVPVDPARFDPVTVRGALTGAARERIREARGADAAPLDLAYERRRVYYLIKLVSVAQESAAAAAGGAAAAGAGAGGPGGGGVGVGGGEGEPPIAGPDQLLAAKVSLWDIFESIQNALWEWFGDQALNLGVGAQEFPEASDAEVAARMASPLVRNALLGGFGGFIEVDARPLEEVRNEVADAVADAVGGVLVRVVPGVVGGTGVEEEGEPGGGAMTGDEDGEPLVIDLAHAFEDFPRRDRILLPMEIGGGLRHRDVVAHAQISPTAASATGVPAEAKLAGDSLAHFGGFLDDDWRRNDLLWGRLDAAETLLRAILSDATEEQRREAIATAHEEILLDEKLDAAVFHPDGYGAYLRQHAVGDASVAHLSRLRVLTLSARTVRSLYRMSRKVWRRRKLTQNNG